MAKLNKAQRRQRFNGMVVGVLSYLGPKASTGFDGQDVEHYLRPRAYNSGGFISEAMMRGVIETVPQCANKWRFSKNALEERGNVSELQNVSDELKQLYLAFGDSGTLLIGRSEIAAYFAVKRTSRAVHLPFTHANALIQWLDARKGDFLADGAVWMYLKPIPEDWQNPAAEGEASQKCSDEDAAKIVTAHCELEDHKMDNDHGCVAVVLLDLPQPREDDHHQRRRLMLRLTQIYQKIGDHDPVPEMVWRQAIMGTSPVAMTPNAVNAWLARQSHEKGLIEYCFAGSGCYKWNVPKLRAFFGMPPEEVSSVATAPALAPSPQEVVVADEEVPDAIVEVLPPLNKAAEFAEFVAAAQPLYLDQLRAQHAEAVAEHSAAQKLVLEAQEQARVATEAWVDAESRVAQLAVVMSERDEALKAELQSIEQIQAQKFVQQLNGLSQNVREQVRQMLNGQQR
jgi:hypothetical protein